MTITVADVQRIHGEELAKGKSVADALMSVRTLVHERLQAERPVPHTGLTPEMQAARDRRDPLTHTEKAQAEAHQRSLVTPDQHEAFGRARAGGNPNARQCRDAHHYVQMLHQTEVWKETDRLVAEAGVT